VGPKIAARDAKSLMDRQDYPGPNVSFFFLRPGDKSRPVILPA
jgi:hypothetical protein